MGLAGFAKQFAGVEVSSIYSIQCLLFYDPDENICDEPPVEPASLTVWLEDGDGEPLGGGEFVVYHDVGKGRAHHSAAGPRALTPVAGRWPRGR